MNKYPIESDKIPVYEITQLPCILDFTSLINLELNLEPLNAAWSSLLFIMQKILTVTD